MKEKGEASNKIKIVAPKNCLHFTLELITLHLWEQKSMKYIKNIHDWGWADKNNKTLYGRILLSLKDKL